MSFRDEDLKRFKERFNGSMSDPFKIEALIARLEAAEAWGIAEREHRLDLQENRLKTQRLADEAEEIWRREAGK